MNRTEEVSSKFLSHFKHLEGDIWLVPCIANYEANTFTPLLQPTSEEIQSPKITQKKDWSEEEDRILKTLVDTRGPNSWSLIAKELNALLHGERSFRAARKCRERWINHLDPTIKRGNWSPGEDTRLIKLQNKFGNRWSEIAKNLDGRNENSVKNRWKSLAKQKKNEETEPVNFEELSKNQEESSFEGVDSPLSFSPSEFLK